MNATAARSAARAQVGANACVTNWLYALARQEGGRDGLSVGSAVRGQVPQREAEPGRSVGLPQRCRVSARIEAERVGDVRGRQLGVEAHVVAAEPRVAPADVEADERRFLLFVAAEVADEVARRRGRLSR